MVMGDRICLMSCEMEVQHGSSKTQILPIFIVFWGSPYLFRPEPLNTCIFGRLYFMYTGSQLFLEMYLLS